MQASHVSTSQLHGTGTPLGDPIELGALAAVLRPPPAASMATKGTTTTITAHAPSQAAPQTQTLPLSLAAVKSKLGHTEAASGVMGIAHGLAGLGAAAADSLLHLLCVSPYVAAALGYGDGGGGDGDISSDAGGGSGRWLLPRQSAPAAAAASGGGADTEPEAAVTGVSAFAFQGTNAHVLLQRDTSNGGVRSATSPSGPLHWRRRRVWVVPPASLLLSAAAAFSFSSRVPGTPAAGAAAVFEVDLRQPALASVLSGGLTLTTPRGRASALLPTGFLLEVCAAALRQLHHSTAVGGVEEEAAVAAFAAAGGSGSGRGSVDVAAGGCGLLLALSHVTFHSPVDVFGLLGGGEGGTAAVEQRQPQQLVCVVRPASGTLEVVTVRRYQEEHEDRVDEEEEEESSEGAVAAESAQRHVSASFTRLLHCGPGSTLAASAPPPADSTDVLAALARALHLPLPQQLGLAAPAAAATCGIAPEVLSSSSSSLSAAAAARGSGASAAGGGGGVGGVFGSPCGLEASLQLQAVLVVSQGRSGDAEGPSGGRIQVVSHIDCVHLPAAATAADGAGRLHASAVASAASAAAAPSTDLRLSGCLAAATADNTGHGGPAVSPAAAISQTLWKLNGVRLRSAAIAAHPLTANTAGISGSHGGATDAATAAVLAPTGAAAASVDTAHIRRVVREAVTAALGGGDVADDAPLMSSGLDSLAAAELHSGLQSSLAISLPPTLVFDFPTIAAVADHIAERLRQQQQQQDAGAGYAAMGGGLRRQSRLRGGAVSATASTVVSIVGMSALPWSLLQPAGAGSSSSATCSGDAVSPVPLSRWDAADPRVLQLPAGAAGGALPPQFGAFLPGVDLFDAAAFGISPAEAALMDPQQRMLLAAVLEARPQQQAAAAAAPSGAAGAGGADVGVYVGIGSGDYEALAQRHGVQVRACGEKILPTLAPCDSLLACRYAPAGVAEVRTALYCVGARSPKHSGLYLAHGTCCVRTHPRRSGRTPSRRPRLPWPQAGFPTPLACAAPRPQSTPPARPP